MSMNMHMQLHTHCICNILYLDPLKITTFSVNRLDMVPFDTFLILYHLFRHTAIGKLSNACIHGCFVAILDFCT